MQNIYNGILSIVNGIELAIQFLVNLVKSLFQLMELLGQTIVNTTTLIATLPSWLIAIATATLGVSVLYIIIGRETGK